MIFFEYHDQWSPKGSINATGGKASLRGHRANCFLARSMWFANFELRTRLAETTLGKQHLSFTVGPFFDIGTVRDRWHDLNFQNVKYPYGAGLRIG